MAFFNFKRLVEKYSTDFIAEIPSKGGYNSAGDYVKGEAEQKTMRGAIISHRESKIFRSEGTITSKDRALYMLEPLDDALKSAKIIHEGKSYSVGDMLENSEFTGVWAYTLKCVSTFKKTSEDATSD